MIARLLIAFGIISFFLNAPLWGQNSLLAYRWDGENDSALMGYSVSGAGDVNADGIPDFIVGAKETKAAGVFRSGSAYVFSGIDGSQIYRWDGYDVDQWVGWSVSGAGDLNLDGHSDLLVCSRTEDVYAYSGQDGSILFQWSQGQQASEAGDVNNDGYPDVLIARGSTAFVYSGSDGSELYNFSGLSSWPQGAVDSAGDINQDGYADVIIGGDGTATVYSGYDGSILHTFASGEDDYGKVVSKAGDLNQDGYPDLLVSAYSESVGTNIWYNGIVYAYSGLDGSTLYTWNGSSTNDQMGYSLASAGDVDGDGVNDVLIGCLNAAYQAYSGGRVIAYSGADGTLIENWDGVNSFARIGVSVSSVGDINLDGRDDVIFGGYLDQNNSYYNAGSAYVYTIPESPTMSIVNLIAGENAILSFAACSPNSNINFAWSTAGGGPLNTSYGIAYISNPFQVIRVGTNSNGSAQLQPFVPPRLSGVSIWFHGVDLGSATLLNPIATSID